MAKTGKRARHDDDADDVVDLDDLGDEEDEEEEERFDRDKSGAITAVHLALKGDHSARPIWVTPDRHVFLETFSPVYKQAYDFLIAIAEPVSRPLHIHEYRLTLDSLFAAVSVGLKTEDVIDVLKRLSKTEIPENVIDYIKGCTTSFGKVKLVLRENKYYLESSHPEALQVLLQDEVIQAARVKETDEFIKGQAPRGDHRQIAGMLATQAAREKEAADAAAAAAAEAAEAANAQGGTDDTSSIAPTLQTVGKDAPVPDDIANFHAAIDEDDDADDDLGTVSFEIGRDHVQKVQLQCTRLNYPLSAEYDFRKDSQIPNIDMDLKPTCVLRPYQEKSLRKMFGNGRARSGIIVLPCGAGKTLTGVTAACTIKKRAIVLCTSKVAVEQWKAEFVRWCNMDDSIVTSFTADSQSQPVPNGIVICTYSMLAHSGKRAERAQRIIDYLQSREWGVMICDEVQTVPADKFQLLLTKIGAHCKLGLTATLVREDDKIKMLNWLIGPKLYEANWIDLQNAGYIARVRCCEVWCPMSPAFFKEYLNPDHDDILRRHLYVTNPNKFQACEFLMKAHEKAGDKVIIFSDDVFALRTLADRLDRPYIDGPTAQSRRVQIINRFKRDPNSRTLFCSKVADNSFDMPDANVLIQISSHGASRMQEAQRLGRILRAKKGSRLNPHEYNAFFYSLVSQDTKEMMFATGRQRFLVNQGYSYQVITHLEGLDKRKLCYGTVEEEQQLLCTVLSNKSTELDVLEVSDEPEVAADWGSTTRRMGSMAAWSGADTHVYRERRAQPTGSKKRSKLDRLRR
eukprot:m.489121 g.489121  ORF g.489121 m.489121 type:complete len:797 (+) comp26400_c0_seq1:233-2623(+)